MNREIKFRGKRIDNDEWIYGDYNSSVEYGDNGAVEVYYQETETKLEYIDGQLVYPETVGQYTGEKDIDGKKIYENDIIKATHSYINCFDNSLNTIEIKNGEICFTLCGFKVSVNVGEHLYDIDLCNNIKVIGNKTDNPELL